MGMMFVAPARSWSLDSRPTGKPSSVVSNISTGDMNGC